MQMLQKQLTKLGGGEDKDSRCSRNKDKCGYRRRILDKMWLILAISYQKICKIRALRGGGSKNKSATNV